MSGDEDRPRRSWREIDQMRDGTRARGERRPRGAREEARTKQATQAYVAELDKLFSSDEAGSRGAELAAAIRDAHGSPDLPGACRAYLDEIGPPGEVSLLALFLDSRDTELIVKALEVMLTRARAGQLDVSAGLRSQLRILSEGFDNDVADAAEELLEVVGA